MSNITKTDPDIRTPGEVVDVRGPRFVAWVTTAVLVVTLLTSTASAAAAAVILGVQAVVFAIGAVPGPLQLVGLLFAVVGVIGFAGGLPSLGLTATGLALVTAFLNAAFGICLGCQLYPLVTRLRPKPRASTT